MTAQSLPTPVDAEETYVLLADVLAVLDGFTAAGLTSPASIVDAIYARLQEVRPRPVPDGGRLLVMEVHGKLAGDLNYIEATRNFSAAGSVRWSIDVAAAELVERETISRKLARALHVDLIEARSYVDRDRTSRQTARTASARLV